MRSALGTLKLCARMSSRGEKVAISIDAHRRSAKGGRRRPSRSGRFPAERRAFCKTPEVRRWPWPRHAFHLRIQGRVGLGELSKAKPRHFGDDVINGGFETGGGLARMSLRISSSR